MKKTLLILACAATAATMSAQLQVVKDAEKAMKSGKDYSVVLQLITPAQSNPETEKDAAVFYIPGKAGFNQYDNLLGKRQLGMLPEGGELTMAQALMGGMDNFFKALPLDTVVDAKGKVKTKYSKEIKNLISGHYLDLTDAGAFFYSAKEYDNAIRAWDTFIELTDNADKYGIKALPDSTASMYLWNAGLAAYENNDYKLSAKKLVEAGKRGYDKEILYQYGLQIAQQADDPDAIYFFACEGDKIYGNTDPRYVNGLINYYLNAQKYDDATKFLNEAISKNPGTAQYYALLGIIYDAQDKSDDAAAQYHKALSIDPDNGLANHYLGRNLLIEAGRLGDAYDGPMNQYEAYKEQKQDPLFREAIKYLETAYEKDPDRRKSTLNMLDQLYYNLNDQAGQESVKQRLLDLDD